jgi:hypothetical protein
MIKQSYKPVTDFKCESDYQVKGKFGTNATTFILITWTTTVIYYIFHIYKEH